MTCHEMIWDYLQFEKFVVVVVFFKAKEAKTHKSYLAKNFWHTVPAWYNEISYHADLSPDTKWFPNS